jgi:hypothetical protein
LVGVLVKETAISGETEMPEQEEESSKESMVAEAAEWD